MASAKYRFEGNRAVALVELAKVARETNEPARAGELLVRVTDDPEAFGAILVEVLIVQAQLLPDPVDSSAQEIWRSVLAHPDSTQRQRELAQKQLVAPPLD